jgi:DNA-directed RNA polymerase specialized sigma24 family protein
MSPALHASAADEPPLDSPVSRPGSDLGSSRFHEELTRIWRDPQIWRLALGRAGNRDLAEDALQETFYSVARMADHSHIRDLRAFFCRALINQIRHLRGLLSAIPVEDPQRLAGLRPQEVGQPDAMAARPVEDAVVWRQLAAMWCERFHHDRERLMAMVPERSGNPARYREVIVATAAQILNAPGDGHVNWADSDMALRAAYPDWFSEPDCTRDTYYQRLSRARHEVRTLLKAVVRREEL